jgi:hypothetical protein
MEGGLQVGIGHVEVEIAVKVHWLGVTHACSEASSLSRASSRFSKTLLGRRWGRLTAPCGDYWRIFAPGIGAILASVTFTPALRLKSRLGLERGLGLEGMERRAATADPTFII